jgi:hypothetical protein
MLTLLLSAKYIPFNASVQVFNILLVADAFLVSMLDRKLVAVTMLIQQM